MPLRRAWPVLERAPQGPALRGSAFLYRERELTQMVRRQEPRPYGHGRPDVCRHPALGDWDRKLAGPKVTCQFLLFSHDPVSEMLVDALVKKRWNAGRLWTRILATSANTLFAAALCQLSRRSNFRNEFADPASGAFLHFGGITNTAIAKRCKRAT
jgi:hypothetical protein